VIAKIPERRLVSDANVETPTAAAGRCGTGSMEWVQLDAEWQCRGGRGFRPGNAAVVICAQHSGASLHSFEGLVNMGSVQQRLLVGHIPAIASFCGEFLPYAVQLNSSGSLRCAQKCAWRRRV